ncbi:zinc-finger homeodomain protein 9 [Punica granatum]|uniref:Zinc-finger homeodomain protein 9 n=1 Tax=Punica granatum TaxID=22663 RepID=A0A6P8CIC4_PUNGR|nr:zinc-finger homeodomain protein 9 [Punica granatum]
MDLTPTPTNTTSNTTNTASTKSPDPEPDTPTRIQPLGKPLSFTNGVLKRHHHHHHHAPPPPPGSAAVTYRECLKNHAASLGGHALDGCGEFMPSPASNDADPTSIKCAACGCHRNFHRREPEDAPPSSAPAAPATHVIEYQPHHRHHPPPPHPHPPPPRSPDSSSPPPISSSYYGHPAHPHHPHHPHHHHHHSAAPHVLLALSTAAAPENSHPPPSSAAAMVSPIARKRFRTKFTQAQKERMFEFAERVGWKIQKRDEDIIQEFCHEIGVERSVLKVWMHNNKNTLGKRSTSSDHNLNINTAATPTDTTNNDNNINSTENYDIPAGSQLLKSEAPNGDGHHHNHHHHHNRHHAGTNGSCSS